MTSSFRKPHEMSHSSKPEKWSIYSDFFFLLPDSFYLLVLMFSTVVVNFVDLTGLRDTGKALFLGVSGRD